MKDVLLITFFLSCVQSFAQNDSATFNAEQFLQIVKEYHPVVKLAGINIEKTNAEIQIAKGVFNPIISNYVSNKTFENTSYYNYTNPAITIPTWFGIDVSVGVENLSGNRFSPSETLGQTSYLDVNIPILSNIIIDKRRAYIQQANMYKEIATIEQQIIINNILQEAIIHYWEWVNAYEILEIISKFYSNSKQRFEWVKKSFLNGERPAIDTLEAFTQLQNFEFAKNESYLQFQNKGLEMSVFLWKENNIPYQIPTFVVPKKGWENEAFIKNFTLELTDLLSHAHQFHPELMIYTQKFKFLDVDKKIKQQNFLPKLDFRYSHLSKGYNMFTTKGLLFENNFQYGLKLEMPLLFSIERGEYKKVKIKIQETEILKSLKMQSIDLKVKNYFNEYSYLKNQIELQSYLLSNLQNMLKAEETLFANGESTLFLINSRENKVLETERKLVELKTKYFKTIYTLQWSAGLLQ